MTPAEHIIPNQYKGDTFDGIEFTYQNTDTKQGVNLIGVQIKVSFIGGFDNLTVVKTLSNNNGIKIVDAPKGIFQIEPFIIDWEAGEYKYDVETTFPSGEVKTYIRGTVTVEEDTTN